MSAFSGRREWKDIAEDSFSLVIKYIERYPTMFSNWLCAIDFALNPIYEIAILGDSKSTQREMLSRAVWSSFRPNSVVAISNYPPESNSPTLLFNRELVDNSATAYVCQRFVCKKPVNTPNQLLEILN